MFDVFAGSRSLGKAFPILIEFAQPNMLKLTTPALGAACV